MKTIAAYAPVATLLLCFVASGCRSKSHRTDIHGATTDATAALAPTDSPADAGYERNIDSHIKSLRSKLRGIAADAEPIQTHRGLGYSYSPGHS